MLSRQGFDLWADQYDADTKQADDGDRYPFAGYRRVLNHIYRSIRSVDAKAVLDIGIGTAVLASRLYRDGYAITGVDFSAKMLEAARQKMPLAALYQCDFSQDIPKPVMRQRFDHIVCTYAIHHLADAQKITLIMALFNRLNNGGAIYIGDVAFSNRKELLHCREQYADEWDDDEYYLVFDELHEALRDKCTCRFEQMSLCGGVITIIK